MQQLKIKGHSVVMQKYLQETSLNKKGKVCE